MTSMENPQAATEHQQQKQGAPTICEECNSNAFKYKCPACSRRTCSLSCVKSHKQRFDCTGKRDVTKFVPLNQFDDSTLLSDYNLLEDVKRVADSAKRKRWNLGGYPQFRLPFPLKALRNNAGRKGTKLLFLPAGMSKREKNKTYFDKRRKSISWTIEWRFHSTDVVLLEHGVHESSTLRSVMEKHLQPSPWRTKLRRFCDEDLSDLKFFIRKYQKGSKSPYRELDLDIPFSQLFAGLVILEYPAIHVFLSSDSYDFEVVKDIRPPPIRQESKEPDREDSLSQVGITFKEEEIVEDERAPETQIIDLLKSSEADAHKPTSQGVQINGKQSIDSSDGQSTRSLQSNNMGRSITESDKAFPSTSGREVRMIDANINDFDFDQELIDAYSFLMVESNPDDFLDYKLEGEGEDHKDTNAFFADVDELEEGEIPSISD